MSSEFDQQLNKLLEREKIARVNNEHFVSVTVLKDIVPVPLPRSPSAIRPRTGKSCSNRSTS